ncbi:hypothetical protein CG002_02290 [Mesoplasma florum]|uniref:lipoprotein n=1 Tax=Mesoplasma florum TaxID=2151 RepID=UPI000D087059|nr:lipoprotein [Mesoplasma florum]AVN65178.1 hypothetical protein CG002_02290 [Mesoplasma florum]
MKKLLSILGAVGLTATGASLVVSCGGGTTDPQAETDLAKLVTNTDIKLVQNDDIPSSEEGIKSWLLDSVIEANSKASLTKEDLMIVEGGTHKKPTFTLKSKTTKYTGEVLIKFSVETNISNLIKTTELTVSMNANEKDIIAIIETQNKGFKYDQSYMELNSDYAKDGSFAEYTFGPKKVAQGQSEPEIVYTGEATVKVTFESDISKLVTKTDIVVSEDATDRSEIISAIKEQNPTAFLGEVDIIKNTETALKPTPVEVAAKESETLAGTYIIRDKNLEGTVIIDVTTAKDIAKVEGLVTEVTVAEGTSEANILNAIVKANTSEPTNEDGETITISKLVKDQLKVVKTVNGSGENEVVSYTLESSDNGTTYMGSVELTVTFLKDLTQLGLNTTVNLLVGIEANEANIAKIFNENNSGKLNGKELTVVKSGTDAAPIWKASSTDFLGEVTLTVKKDVKANLTGVSTNELLKASDYKLRFNNSTKEEDILSALNKHFGLEGENALELSTPAVKEEAGNISTPAVPKDVKITITKAAWDKNGVSQPGSIKIESESTSKKVTGSTTITIAALQRVDITWMSKENTAKLEEAANAEGATETTMLAKLNEVLGLEGKDALELSTPAVKDKDGNITTPAKPKDVAIEKEAPKEAKKGSFKITIEPTNKLVKGKLVIEIKALPISLADGNDAVALKDFKASNETKKSDIVKALNTQYELTGEQALVSTDVDVTITKATPGVAGSVKVEGKSDKISGTKNIAISALAAVNLSTVTDLGETGISNDLDDAAILTALSTKLGFTVSEGDVTITIAKATPGVAGSIKIEAKSTSKKVSGTKTIVIEALPTTPSEQ